MAGPTASEIERIAMAIATDLCSRSPALVRGDTGRVAKVVAETIAANFAEEAAIDREALRALEAMGSQTAGMDRGKLHAGLRERIAKQRGFVL